MPTFQSGPFNIEKGNSANFTIEFFDSLGALSIPAGAGLTVTYTNTSFTTQVDSVQLTQSGSFFTGTWSSVPASLGLATWVTTALPSSVQTATGQLRIIQRKAG